MAGEAGRPPDDVALYQQLSHDLADAINDVVTDSIGA